jgi:hypothetical protein
LALACQKKRVMLNRGAKYRLAFSAAGAAHSDAPSNGDFQTLAGALAAAWASDASGGRLLGVTFGGLPVMGAEDLKSAVERLSAIEGECPDDGKIRCAERVLREMGLE